MSLFVAEKATLNTYKEVYWQIWIKYEPRLPLYIQFYAKNVCQMRKTRLEVKADLTIRVNTYETAQLEVKNRCNNLSDMVDNNGEAKIDSSNMRLVEFGI